MRTEALSATATHVGQPETSAETPRAHRRSRYLNGLLSPRGLIGAGLVLGVVVAALVLPLVLANGPLDQSSTALAPPSAAHLLGTDEVGRDILARVVAGVRLDLILIVVGIPISAVVGTSLGMLSTWTPLAGDIVQAVFSMLLGFPGVVMGVAISIAISPGESSVLVAIVLVTIPSFGRQVRTTAMTQLSREYVAAATVLGTRRRDILVRHVLPNVADAILVRAAVTASQAIQIEGALSVVGLGIQPPQASLGAMISDGSQYLTTLPLYSIAPVAVVFVMILGFVLLADALNEALLR